MQALTSRAIPVSASFPKGSDAKMPAMKNHMFDNDLTTTKHLRKTENARFVNIFIMKLYVYTRLIFMYLPALISTYVCKTGLQTGKGEGTLYETYKAALLILAYKIFAALEIYLCVSFFHFFLKISINKAWKSHSPHLWKKSSENVFLVALGENKLHEPYRIKHKEKSSRVKRGSKKELHLLLKRRHILRLKPFWREYTNATGISKDFISVHLKRVQTSC